MVDNEGFEPSIGCPILAFQASAFDHSASCPFCLKMKFYYNFSNFLLTKIKVGTISIKKNGD